MTGDRCTPVPLTIRCETHGDVLVVFLIGEFDLAAKGRLADATRAQLDGASRIVFDMSELTFMDSTGLADIVAVNTTEKARGRGVAIRAVHPHVRRVFEITGLDSLLDD
jgi:anti-anti-sigma factor